MGCQLTTNTYGMDHPVIHICHARSCRRAGSEAVLSEIEELAKGLGQCTIKRSGCLGYCGSAPSALIVQGTQRSYKARICTLEKCAAVVQQATGVAPKLDDAWRQQHPKDARQLRTLDRNAGVRGSSEHAARSSGRGLQRKLSKEGASLSSSSTAIPKLPNISARTHTYASSGVAAVNVALPSKSSSTRSHEEGSQKTYSEWCLNAITAVSQHSAIYHFTSTDRRRGSPNACGSGRAKPAAKTWHTTLFAEVGPNCEGPFQWIERDYTPISTAKEWESGKVDVLIKIYEKGLATSWLYQKPLGSTMWLSLPEITLHMPSLVAGVDRPKIWQPRSVLLLLAGSGIVIASQILQHQDTAKNIGMTSATNCMLLPINLIYSCRKDDICMLKDISAWCKLGLTQNRPPEGLMRCSLLLTEPRAGTAAPFPGVKIAAADEFEALDNTRILEAHVSKELVIEELALMQSPCRVVVSGPAAFNTTVQTMLLSVGVDKDAITILEA